jgi:hypothetical protein
MPRWRKEAAEAFIDALEELCDKLEFDAGAVRIVRRLFSVIDKRRATRWERQPQIRGVRFLEDMADYKKPLGCLSGTRRN